MLLGGVDMKTGKVLVCDGLLAMFIIFGLSTCDKKFNTQKLVSKGSEKITSLASLYK
jgi:hypothetical protein